MEFSSLWYLSFWSIIRFISLAIALVAIKEASLPVPPIILLIYFFTCIFAGFSSFYGFIIRPLMEPDLSNGNISKEIRYFFASLFSLFVVCYIVLSIPMIPRWPLLAKVVQSMSTALLPAFFVLIFPRYREAKDMGKILIGFGGPLIVFPSHTLCCALSTISLYSIVLCLDPFPGREILFQVAFISCPLCIAVIIVVCCFVLSLRPLFMSYKMEKIKAIEPPLGLLGYVLVQYCITEKSVSLLVMLCSLTIFWVSNIAMIQPSTDLGISNFFVGSTLDCAISLFGLTKITWIVFVYCLVLVIWRLKMNTVILRYPRAHTSIMSDWLSLEEKIINNTIFPCQIILKKVLKLLKSKNKGTAEKIEESKGFAMKIDISSIEQKPGGGGGKDEPIDELNRFVLRLNWKNKNGKDEEIKDEVIRRLYRLYFRLCNEEEEEKEMGEETSNYKIAMWLYQVLYMLRKEEIQEELEKEKEENYENVAKTFRLYSLIFGMISMKKDVKEKEEIEGVVVEQEARIIRACRLIFGLLLLKGNKVKKMKKQ